MAKYNDILTDILNKLPSGTPNGIGITAEKHREVETSILNFAKSQWQIGDIKEVDCTDAYIAANFIGGTGPTSGLGIIGGDREGWAICNGNNLTVNLTGRVCIAYGTNPPVGINSFPTVGATGGSKDSVVVDHTHTFNTRTEILNLDDDNDSTSNITDVTKTTGPASGGVPGTDKNMQPYIVTLFIQKIS